MADLDGMPSLCKTVKLIGDPSLKQLRLGMLAHDSTDSGINSYRASLLA